MVSAIEDEINDGAKVSLETNQPKKIKVVIPLRSQIQKLRDAMVVVEH